MGVSEEVAASSSAAADSQPLSALLHDTVESGVAPGVIGAVTDLDATEYIETAGVRVIDGQAMTVDTVFHIASMTKAVASTVAVILVERGLLDLTSPITRWDSMAAEFKVLTGFAGEKPILRAPSRDITLFDLLTHTSGLVYRNWNADFDAYMSQTNHPFLYSGEPSGWFPPLLFDPGTRWEYGTGIDWAGRLVEAVSGMTLADWMKKELFDPLGMKDTSYHLRPDMAERLATLHMLGDQGLTPEAWPPPSPVRGAGGFGLYSTAPDYLKFIRLFLNGGAIGKQRIFGPQSMSLLRHNAIPHVVRRLHSTNVERQADINSFPDHRFGWSLGFMVNEDELPTGRSPNSMAWSGLFNTHYWIDPDKKIGGLFMSQTLPYANDRLMKSYLEFERLAYQHFT